MVTSRITELVGRVLEDRYRLIRPIGAGASAHVYAADDVRLRRRVAVKVLHPGLAADEAFRRRFQAEAQVVAALSHPHIVAVYDWGVDEGAPYLVTALLEGGSLRSLLDRGNVLTPAQAASVGADVADALDYAHRRDLVHRDIKPANLIFDDEGRVTVADFGLARALAEASWTEPAGAVLGTVRYAAPEQAEGRDVGAAADVYALALVLVEAMTGAVPFATNNVVGTLMARREHPLIAPASLGRIGRVIEAAGAIRPADRLDAARFAAGLRQVAKELPAPGSLPLAGPILTGDVERDADPTQVPGPAGLAGVEGRREPGGPTPGRPGADTGSFGAALPPPPARSAGPGGHPRASASGEDRYPEDRYPEDRYPEDRTLVVGRGVFDADAVDRRSERGRGVYDAEALAADDSSEGIAAAAPSAGRRPRRWRRRVRRRVLLALAVVVVVAAGGGAYVVTRPGPRHPVPAVQGRTEAQAASALTPLHLHLDVTARRYDPTAPSGVILTQTPAATTRLPEGSVVRAVVSEGPKPVEVPPLAGQTEAAARPALVAAGLQVGTVTQASSETVPSGQVISTSPVSGTLLPGQTVNLVVSTGKPFVTVPLLSTAQSASFATAQAAFAGLGLSSVESDQFSDTVAKGQVIATSPAPGVSVQQGTSVTVQVSKGPDLVAVPNVRGTSVTAASQAIAAAGLAVSGVNGNPTATVTGTSPAAGAMVHRGASVEIDT